MRIAITGAHGFMGQNLQVRLTETGHVNLVRVPHDADDAGLMRLLEGVQIVFHLAGVNRSQDPLDFSAGNTGFTQRLCRAMSQLPAPPRVAYSSSTQATLDNPYGQSKREAEQALFHYGQATGAQVQVFRLPNVFGKWCRPNYNSAVATFCHNIARDIPITISDTNARVHLVYIDDVTLQWLALLDDTAAPSGFRDAGPVNTITVGELAVTLQGFKGSRQTLLTDPVGTGLTRQLYATYMSFLPVEKFHYDVPRHGDPRGVFVEMLKTQESGQFSYFTAHPGITRGEHYHHTKTEKFLVIKGSARFAFRHILTDETHELFVQGAAGRIVETVPGWTHNITNVGNDELIVMLWANEIFDRARPDTVAMKV